MSSVFELIMRLLFLVGVGAFLAFMSSILVKIRNDYRKEHKRVNEGN